MKTLTVLEYAQQIGVAPVTVYRRIDGGELQAIIEDGVKKVIVNDDEIPETHSQTSEIQIVSSEEYISELKREIERLESQNDELLIRLFQLASNPLLTAVSRQASVYSEFAEEARRTQRFFYHPVTNLNTPVFKKNDR